MKKVPYTTRENLTIHKLGTSGEGTEAWNVSRGDAVSGLTNLSNDLPKVKDNAQYTRSDVSVPSPWANVIFFDSLLKDKNGEFGILSKQAKKDWRTLIAIMALKDVWDLNVSVETIDMSKDAKNLSEKDMYENLMSMKPRTQIFETNECWNIFNLIKIEGCTVGILSNSFLVCSAYKESFKEDSYKHTVEYLKQYGLMDDEFNFIDPTEEIKKDFSLLVYVVSYLERLKELIIDVDRTGRNRVFIAEICALIDNYVVLLKNNLNDKEILKCTEITTENKLYIFNDEDIVSNNIGELFANVKLKAVNLNAVVDIVVDKNDNLMLNELGESLDKIRNIRYVETISPEGKKTMSDNSIFLDRLTLVDCLFEEAPFKKFKIGKIFKPADRDEGGFYCLLPLKESVFDMYPSEYEVRENIKIDGNYEEGIDVIVKYVISGIEKEMRNRYYPSSYNYITDDEVPFVAVWPYADINVIDPNANEKKSAWNDFYIFEEKSTHNNKCEVDVKYKNQIEGFEKAELADRRDGKIRSVSATRKLPTYMKIKKLNNMDVMEDLGLILFKKPEINSIINKDNIRYVGMDFGTTSTTAFCSEKINDQKEKFIKFGSMKRKQKKVEIAGIPGHANRDIDKEMEAESIGGIDNACCIVYSSEVDNEKIDSEPALDFVPLSYVGKKFYPSIFKFNVRGGNNDIVEHSLMNGNILFNSAIIDDNANRDLKWGRHGNQQPAMKGYLTQFMKTIAFTLAKEGVGQILWRFSYPTALSKSEEKSFRKDVLDIVDNINKNTGIKSLTESGKTFYTESIVAAQFNKGTRDYLCIDIGGGSTDVSLWKGRVHQGEAPENLIQFSMGIASRKIFAEAMANLIINCKDTKDLSRVKLQEGVSSLGPTYRDIINSTIEKISPKDQVVSMSKDEISKTMTAFARELESAINNNGKEIMDFVMSSTICDEDTSDKFFKYVITGFFGLLYYTVLSMKPIKEQLDGVTHLDIVLAGNGSSLYEWLIKYYRGSDSEEKVFTKAIKALVKEELGLDINFEIKYDNNQLKTEAAKGLLRMDVDTDATYDKNIVVINGDTYKVDYYDGRTESWDKDTNLAGNEDIFEYFANSKERKIKEINILYDKHSDTVKKFVDSLNNYMFGETDLKLDIDELPADEMQRIISDAMKRNIDNGTVAPAFILEVEAILSVLAGYHLSAVIND